MSDVGTDQSLEQEINTYLRRHKIIANIIGISAGIILAFLLTLVIAGISTALIVVFREQDVLKRKNIAIQAAGYAGSEISKFLEVNFQALIAMGESVIQNNYSVDAYTFRNLSSRLKNSYPLILAYEYAIGPDMTLSYVEPGPSPVLGLKLLRYNEIHAKQIMKAITNNTIAMYGPFNLIQGGIAMNAFYPIMFPNNTAYGISSILVMLDNVLTSLNIYSILESYNYQFKNVYGIFAQDNGPRITSTMNKQVTPLNDAINVSIVVANEQWYLYLQPKEGWYHDPYIWLETLVILALIIVAGSCVVLVTREVVIGIIGRKSSDYVRDVLERQVAQRTKEIMISNMKLVSQLEQREDIDNVWGLSWLSSIDGTVTSANESFITLLGTSPIGKKLNDIFTEIPSCEPNKTIRKKLVIKSNGATIKAIIRNGDNKLIIAVTQHIDDAHSSNASNK